MKTKEGKKNERDSLKTETDEWDEDWRQGQSDENKYWRRSSFELDFSLVGDGYVQRGRERERGEKDISREPVNSGLINGKFW